METITQTLTDLTRNDINLGQLLPFFSRFLLQAQILTSYVSIGGIFLFIIVVLFVARQILATYLGLKRPYTFLEVKPPQETLKSSYTTEQLFNLLHGLARQQSWFHRMIGLQKSYAFEIVSTKDEGIRYLLRVNEEDADLIKKNLLSYLPGMSVLKADDYFPNEIAPNNFSITRFILANHFAFPLKKQTELSEHDPIAYITGNMTKLSQNEIVAFQIIASPLNKSSASDIKRISQLIYKNKDLASGLRALSIGNRFIAPIKFVFFLLFYLFTLPLGIIVFIFSDGREGPLLPLPFRNDTNKTPNPYQEELETQVKAKLDQQLFSTSLRLLVISDKASAHHRIRGFTSSLASFSNSSYQYMKKSKNIRLKIFEKYELFVFKRRLLNMFHTAVLSVSEVSDLYHFPFTTITRTEDIQKVHSKVLPAPVALKKAQDLDVVFAKNTYGGNTTLIGLNQEERRRHMYVLGATGTGKSTLLLSMIDQDLKNGKGLCVIDPHGELIENILPLIPENRIKDVVYFNPDDISFPVGLNLLELPKDISGDLLLREKELIAESIISLFHKIYDDKYSGPRMEYILRNTIHTAFTLENPTLFTIYKLLINDKYRKQVTKSLTDENLIDFWRNEFGKAGDFQKVKMISPITNKIGRFLFSPTAKRILEQEKSTINFDEIMDSGKILLCNVSKGKIGEDNSAVFGALIMAKIQLAALKRARTKSAERKDFYFYVDEFQNFATPSFAQILSEARKYKLNAILAHQTTSQLEDKSLVNVTLANTGTIICFRTANPEDERLILPQFIPYVQHGEIDNLPSFHFYIKIAALRPEEPFSGQTMPVMIPDSEEKVERIIKASRDHFAKEFVAQVVKTRPIESEERKPKVKQARKTMAFPD
jgi:hypothetical protein